MLTGTHGTADTGMCQLVTDSCAGFGTPDAHLNFHPMFYASAEAHPTPFGTVSAVNLIEYKDIACPEPESNRHGLAAGGF